MPSSSPNGRKCAQNTQGQNTLPGAGRTANTSSLVLRRGSRPRMCGPDGVVQGIGAGQEEPSPHVRAGPGAVRAG